MSRLSLTWVLVGAVAALTFLWLVPAPAGCGCQSRKRKLRELGGQVFGA